MHTTMANENYEKNGEIYLKCKECGKFKIVSKENWYKHNEGYLGVLGRCKECIKKGRKTEKELVMARERDTYRYYNNTKRKKYLFKSAKIRRLKKGYGNLHLKTNRHIKKIGIRPKICPICNKEHKRIMAHHFDYNYYNKFIFCCPICHNGLHSNKIKMEDCEIIILPH